MPLHSTNKKVMAIDLEVRSGLDLKKVELSEYVLHPTTKVLVVGWCIEGEEPQSWTYKNNDLSDIKTLLHFMESGKYDVVCHNAEYDISVIYGVLAKQVSYPTETLTVERLKNFYCTKSIAMWNNLPSKLEKLSNMFLGKGKMAEGGELIEFFCFPHERDGKPRFLFDEQRFKTFVEYCEKDAKLCLDLFIKLREQYEFTEDDNRLMWLYTFLNFKGVCVDKKLCDVLLKLHEDNQEVLSGELQELTDGEIRTPNQVKVMTEYLRKFEELKDLKGLSEKELAKLEVKNPKAKRIIEIRRLAAGRGSTIKTLLSKVKRDGRLRHYIMHRAAASGRCRSKGFNVQNLPRPPMDEAKDPQLAEKAVSAIKKGGLFEQGPGTIIKSFMRGVIVADKGKKFVSVDFSGLEYRLINYLAGDTAKLRAIEDGGTTQFYVNMARDIYGKKDIDKNSEEYVMGKTATLALGYMMGYKKFYEQFSNICESKEVAKRAIEAYKRQHPKIQQTWYRFGAMIDKAPILSQGETSGKNMFIRTLGGRRIAFKNVRRVFQWYDEEQEDGTFKKVRRLSGLFDAWNSITNLPEAGYIHGGTVTNYYCQGSAADIVDAACLSVYKKLNLIPVMNIHDELVYEVDKNFNPDKIKEAMLDLPEWCKVPLEADYWEAKRYGKY